MFFIGAECGDMGICVFYTEFIPVGYVVLHFNEHISVG